MNDRFKPFLNKLSPSVTDMIRMDHSQVLATFHRFEPGARPQTKQALVSTACLALEIHAQLEEEIFYPAIYDLAAHRELVEKSVPEHDEMRRLIAALRGMQPENPAYDATFMDLMRVVIHHVADEETTLLPDAERLLGDRVGELGARMTKRRLQLTAPHAGELARNAARAMPTMSVLFAAGALIAGTYMVKRTFTRPPQA
jgi:hemerythrin superfamily protein